MIEYIVSGVAYTTPKQFRFQGIGLILLAAIFTFVPGILLGKYFLVLGIIGFTVAIAGAGAVVVCSLKRITIKQYLILQVLMAISFTTILSLSSTILCAMRFGVNGYLLFIWFLPIVLPLLVGFKTSKKIRNNMYHLSRGGTVISVLIGSGIAGLLGVQIGKLFKNATQNVVVVGVLLCNALVVICSSIGLLSIQKLHYVYKLEKKDQFYREFFAQNCYTISKTGD